MKKKKKRRRRKLKKSVSRAIKLFCFALIVVIFTSHAFHSQAKEPEKLKAVSFDSFTNQPQKMLKMVEHPENYPEAIMKMLENNIDMLDYVANYPEKAGKVYSDTIGEMKKGEVPLLLQYDERWGYGIYGDDVIAVEGCAPTSLAMVIAYLTNDPTITPYVVANYAKENGYYVSGIGSNWSLMSEGSKHFGVIGKEVPLVKNTIMNYLESGKPMIASMGPGDFTRSGHFIVLTGTENGKIKVNDPNSTIRSNQLWDYDKIKSQIKNIWVFEKAK